MAHSQLKKKHLKNGIEDIFNLIKGIYENSIANIKLMATDWLFYSKISNKTRLSASTTSILHLLEILARTTGKGKGHSDCKARNKTMYFFMHVT